MSLFVDGRKAAASVHGTKLRCTDCHRGMDEVPHPTRTVRTAAEFRGGLTRVCASCHFEKFRQYADGVHHAVAAKGDSSAPGCTDCHGAHDVARPAVPRTRISETCAGCHPEVADTYATSAHGKGLSAGNEDVPVCTDCHRAHDITSPRKEAWLLRTPEMCGSCHADGKKMAKYGLSTAVLRTYLADFHGMAASLRKVSPENSGRITALCVDCHGVHDIAKVDDPASP
ncbi:MAG TPA: cytochrome c3 family protein, partial [Vicinamibacteria bacterium]|nr:cytochrome c3 family protein [Vicinamibacteria bacterium]